MVALARNGTRPWAATVCTSVTRAAEYAADALCRSTNEKCQGRTLTPRQNRSA